MVDMVVIMDCLDGWMEMRSAFEMMSKRDGMVGDDDE
jgi:hypothetical protein